MANADYATSQWQPGEIIWHYYTLQVDDMAAAGTATLSLALLDAHDEPVGTLVRLGEIELDGHLVKVPAIENRQEAILGDSIRFLGYVIEEHTVLPGQSLNLTLYWQAERPIASSYKVFTHLLDQNGTVRGQQDSIPRNGLYPTSEWLAGEVIVDRYVLIDQEASPGSYRLEIGMYDPQQANARVPLYAVDGVRLQDDRLLLDIPVVVE